MERPVEAAMREAVVLDAMLRCREAAEAIEVAADLCTPKGADTTARAIPASRVGPLFSVLSDGLTARLSRLEAEIGTAEA